MPPEAAAPAVPTNPAIDAAKAVQTPPVEAKKEATVRVRSHERAARVKAKLESEGEKETSTPEPAAERETPNEAPARRRESSSAADSGADAPANDTKPAPKPEPTVDAAAEQRRAERAERIRKAQAREQAEDRERATRHQSTTSNAEVEKLRKRVAELEPHEQVFASEEALLAAAEARGMSAEKLVQWMRTRLSDPSAVAQRHAQTEAEKLRAEMRLLQDRIDQQEQERQAERARHEEEQHGLARARTFVKQAGAAKESHPLTAALLLRYGDVGLLQFANRYVAPHLRTDYSLEELHDHVEQLLDVVQVGGASSPGTPANGTSHSPSKNGAAEPTTTLSNRLGSERVSVTEEIPFRQLPRSERVRRIKEKLDGG